MIDLDLVFPYGHLRAIKYKNGQEFFDSCLNTPLEFKNKMKFIPSEFIFLDDLFIEKEFRRQGLATELLISFLEKNNEQTIYLISGSQDTPKKMDITSWYEDLGFEVLEDSLLFPIMVKRVK